MKCLVFCLLSIANCVFLLCGTNPPLILINLFAALITAFAAGMAFHESFSNN